MIKRMVIDGELTRIATDSMGVVIRPIPEDLTKDIQFDRQKFLMDFREIFDVGGFTIQEVAEATHTAIGTVHNLLFFDESVRITPEIMLFVTQLGDHDLEEYFNNNLIDKFPFKDYNKYNPKIQVKADRYNNNTGRVSQISIYELLREQARLDAEEERRLKNGNEENNE